MKKTCRLTPVSWPLSCCSTSMIPNLAFNLLQAPNGKLSPQCFNLQRDLMGQSHIQHISHSTSCGSRCLWSRAIRRDGNNVSRRSFAEIESPKYLAGRFPGIERMPLRHRRDVLSWATTRAPSTCGPRAGVGVSALRQRHFETAARLAQTTRCLGGIGLINDPAEAL